MFAVNQRDGAVFDMNRLTRKRRVRDATRAVSHSVLCCVAVFFWFGATAATPAAGQPTSRDEWLEEGKALYEAGQFEEATTLFHDAFLAYPGDEEINFHYGLSAAEAGDHETASMAFDRLLIMNPNLPRVRLELSRSYFKLGLYGLAQEQFQTVLETDPPPEVQRRIRAYLETIRSRQRQHALSGSLSFSATSDSNVNISSSNDEVLFPFGTQLLIPGNPIRDQYLAATLQLCHSYRSSPTGNRTWDTCLTQYNASYSDEDQLDISYTRIESGPSLSLGGNRGNLHLRGTASKMDQGGADYQKTFGASAVYAHNLGVSSGWRTRLAGEKRTYDDDPDNDSLNLKLESGPWLRRGPNTFSAAVFYERNDAESGDNAYHGFGLNGAWQRLLNARTLLQTALQYEYSDYDDTAFLYAPTIREDHGLEVDVSLRRQLAAGVSARIGYAYEKLWSNVDIYDYKRHIWSASVQVSF